MDAGDDWGDWEELLRLAEIDKGVRVHDARHTAATLLLVQGVDIRVIQAVLGHSRLTTIKRYTHITETLAIEAAGRMGRALWGGWRQRTGHNRDWKSNRAGFPIMEKGSLPSSLG
ncbi:tyrosine-type recombinase/integrase [Streptosporangium sp. NPDC006013]|uniref:tyrosine-type recombinase/integrase n=1 Tax=Streptosporangium sp. NPDC006013 TaxID=3155596 RepID=UPI0033BDF6C0